MCTWNRSVKRRFSDLRRSLGVQFPFNTATIRSTNIYMLDQHKKRDAVVSHQWRKRTQLRGRIGGVVPPASRRFPSTLPLFAPAALNGIPTLRRCRFEPSR